MMASFTVRSLPWAGNACCRLGDTPVVFPAGRAVQHCQRMTKGVALLRQLRVFADVSEGDLQAAAHAVTSQRHRRGHTVVEQGAEADAVYGVLSGRLKVVLPGPDGTDATVAVLGPGEIFGELALLRRSTRSARVVALDDVELARLAGAAFLELVARSHALSRQLNTMLAERMLGMGGHLESVTTSPVAQRVARALLELVTPHLPRNARTATLDPSLSQQELAELAHASRQSVNECLQRWRRDGILEHDRRRVVFHDLPRLRALAEGPAPPARSHRRG
ncbi:MAG: Crp/Fnr family transcriptional regulator [Myxococcota bacterium]